MTTPKKPENTPVVKVADHEINASELSTSTELGSTAAIEPITAEDESQLVRGTSRLKLYVRRFFRNKGAFVGTIIFAALVLFATFGEYLSAWDYQDPDFLNLSTPPSPEHWFGTTDGGHDLFAQVAHGLGRSLTIGLSVAISTTFLSAVIGAGAALLRGRVERVVLGVIHFMLAVPSFLLIVLLVSDSGGDWRVLIIVMILFGWMYSARVVWSLSMSVRELDFVRAARYMGVSQFTVVLRHMLPNISSLLVIQFVLGTVSTINSETGLSFLGLGVKLPDVSLGTLLSTGTATVITAPWQFYAPALTLTLLTTSLALIADGLRDAIDPNSKSGGKA